MFSNLTGRFESVHLRHRNIHENEIMGPGNHGFQRLQTVVYDMDLVTTLAQ